MKGVERPDILVLEKSLHGQEYKSIEFELTLGVVVDLETVLFYDILYFYCEFSKIIIGSITETELNRLKFSIR